LSFNRRSARADASLAPASGASPRAPNTTQVAGSRPCTTGMSAGALGLEAWQTCFKPRKLSRCPKRHGQAACPLLADPIQARCRGPTFRRVRIDRVRKQPRGSGRRVEPPVPPSTDREHQQGRGDLLLERTERLDRLASSGTPAPSRGAAAIQRPAPRAAHAPARACRTPGSDCSPDQALSWKDQDPDAPLLGRRIKPRRDSATRVHPLDRRTEPGRGQDPQERPLAPMSRNGRSNRSDRPWAAGNGRERRQDPKRSPGVPDDQQPVASPIADGRPESAGGRRRETTAAGVRQDSSGERACSGCAGLVSDGELLARRIGSPRR